MVEEKIFIAEESAAGGIWKSPDRTMRDGRNTDKRKRERREGGNPEEPRMIRVHGQNGGIAKEPEAGGREGKSMDWRGVG